MDRLPVRTLPPSSSSSSTTTTRSCNTPEPVQDAGFDPHIDVASLLRLVDSPPLAPCLFAFSSTPQHSPRLARGKRDSGLVVVVLPLETKLRLWVHQAATQRQTLLSPFSSPNVSATRTVRDAISSLHSSSHLMHPPTLEEACLLSLSPNRRHTLASLHVSQRFLFPSLTTPSGIVRTVRCEDAHSTLRIRVYHVLLQSQCLMRGGSSHDALWSDLHSDASFLSYQEGIEDNVCALFTVCMTIRSEPVLHVQWWQGDSPSAFYSIVESLRRDAMPVHVLLQHCSHSSEGWRGRGRGPMSGSPQGGASGDAPPEWGGLPLHENRMANLFASQMILTGEAVTYDTCRFLYARC